MAAVTGYMIGRELCSALGLDIRGVRTIDIHFATNEAVTVTVERLLHDAEAKQLNKVLEKYQLHAYPAETKAEIVDATGLEDAVQKLVEVQL